MAETVKEIVEKDREAFKTKRGEIQAKIAELEKQIAEVDKETAAVEAYYAVMTGKGTTGRQTSGTRAPRGERKKEVFEAIKASSDGLTKSELLDTLGITEDKTATNAVSNVLSVMKEEGKLASEGRGSKYTVV